MNVDRLPALGVDELNSFDIECHRGLGSGRGMILQYATRLSIFQVDDNKSADARIGDKREAVLRVNPHVTEIALFRHDEIREHNISNHFVRFQIDLYQLCAS